MNIMEYSLPCSLDAERWVLSALLSANGTGAELFAALSPEHFSLEWHRRIYHAARNLAERDQHLDRGTVGHELAAHNQLPDDGVSQLVDLDREVPVGCSVESYVKLLGEKAALRRIAFAAHAALISASEGMTPASEIALAFQAHCEAGNAGKGQIADLLNPGEVITLAGGLDAFANPMRLGKGILTGWRRLDEMTCGMHRGDLWVLAGNTSMGKTAASMQMAAQAAEQGQPTLVFSLEMSRDQIIERLICQRARIDTHRFRGGYLSREERDRFAQHAGICWDWPLWTSEHGLANVLAIRAAVRKRKPAVVIVDYLQLMHSLGRAQNRHAELSEITRSLKLLAVEEDVCLVLLSQLSRDNIKEKRPPNLADLRESGSIEENADLVMFVWRPEMLWRDREDYRGQAEFLLLKHRKGPTGKVELSWLPHLTSFENKAAEIS